MKLEIPQYNEEALKNNAAINFNRPYQQCSLSVMDTIADPDITFNEKGICNYYYEYIIAEKEQCKKGIEGEIEQKKNLQKKLKKTPEKMVITVF